MMTMPFTMPATMEESGECFGTGWLPPMPDMRDYTEQTPEIEMLTKELNLGSAKARREAIPPVVDLRRWCSPVEDQGNLGSCTAHAGVGVIEYFECRAFGRHVDASRLFVYKVTRNLMGVTGDTGAWLRTTMGALALCGAPAERYWPYTTAKEIASGPHTFDEEPPSFVYAIADQLEDLRYFCHDPLGQNVPTKKVLESVKAYLAGGIPAMFGFYGFDSFTYADVKGGIPFPCPGEKAKWGHAIVAVGYNDDLAIQNTKCGKATKGALLIRNSWGSKWGDQGYGWLPYDYVLSGLALDFWSLLSMGWIDTNAFGLQ